MPAPVVGHQVLAGVDVQRGGARGGAPAPALQRDVRVRHDVAIPRRSRAEPGADDHRVAVPAHDLEHDVAPAPTPASGVHQIHQPPAQQGPRPRRYSTIGALATARRHPVGGPWSEVRSMPGTLRPIATLEGMKRPVSPLPQRNGLDAARVRLPMDGTWTTVRDHLVHRLHRLEPARIDEMVAAGRFVTANGPVTPDTPYVPGDFVWFHRDLPQEVPVPFDIGIVYRDDDLVVADKPHFLATIPRGKHVMQTALVRLRDE